MSPTDCPLSPLLPSCQSQGQPQPWPFLTSVALPCPWTSGVLSSHAMPCMLWPNLPFLCLFFTLTPQFRLLPLHLETCFHFIACPSSSKSKLCFPGTDLSLSCPTSGHCHGILSSIDELGRIQNGPGTREAQGSTS